MPENWLRITAVLVVVGVVLSAGCVTLKTIKRDLRAKVTPLPTPVPVVIETPIPVPTISQPVVYQEPPESREDYMFRTQGFYMGDYFSWYRENCTMLKDLKVRVTVYGYKWLKSYHYWSIDWGRYFTQPPRYGQKYLVIYPQMCADGDTSSWDARMWGMGADHFYIQYKDQIYYPDTERIIGARVQELENTYTKNDDARVYDYGYYRTFGWNKTERAEPLGYLYLGQSNCWDGFIIYSLPEQAQIEDIKVLGRFDSFGYAWWYLMEKEQFPWK